MLATHDTAIPLYMQIYNHIVERIVAGTYQNGDKLPSQRELAEEFGVSIVTTRKALEQLAHDEIITTKHGTGSFVSWTKPPQQVYAGGSFTETCYKNNCVPETRILSVYHIGANQWVAAGLGLKSGEDVLCIERLRLMDKKECILERDYFSKQYFFLESIVLENRSLLDILSTQIGQAEFCFDDFFDIVFASVEQAKQLDCAPSTPLLRVSEIIKTISGCVLYYNEQFIRSDRYRYATSVRQ